MAPGLIERLQAKIELFRLEQRYTRHRHRRSTFVSNAVYVDGEYIYNTPNTTGSSAATDATNQTAASSSAVPADGATNKRLNRFSSIPGFGSLSKASTAQGQATSWRRSRLSVHEVR